MHAQIRIVLVCVALKYQNYPRLFVTHGQAIRQGPGFVLLDEGGERRKGGLEGLDILGSSECYLDDKPECTLNRGGEGEAKGGL